MNNSILLVKILKKPQQVFFSNDIMSAEVLVRFRCPINYPIYNIGLAVFWGSSATVLLEYYKKNDYIILEGTIGFKKLFLDTNGKNNAKDLEISVLNFHPFLISGY